MKARHEVTYRQSKLQYDNLVKKIKYRDRFFCEHRFLTEIEKSFNMYTDIIGQDRFLYRARIVDKELRKNYRQEDGFRGLNKKDSFVPPKKYTKDNRANPAGIVVLYAAESEHTAIVETRPTMRDRVSVATIKVSQELKILDISFNSLAEPGLPYKKGSHALCILADKFMVPLDTELDDGGYLPVQFATEFIRRHKFGFDGIRYNSSLDFGGKNVVIFNDFLEIHALWAWS